MKIKQVAILAREGNLERLPGDLLPYCAWTAKIRSQAAGVKKKY